MADYPYTNVTGNLKKFFGIIQSSGVPPKVVQKTLETYGFKSTNDRSIIKILKFIGFLSEDGTPLDNWQNYRNKEIAGTVLGSAIKSSYQELFHTYPDAHRKDNEALRNYFSAHTSVGEQALSAMVNTFKTLCDLASFDSDQQELPNTTDFPSRQDVRTNAAITETTPIPIGTPLINTQSNTQGLSLNINIELHLPATQDGGIYDKLFEALNRHILQGK